MYLISSPLLWRAPIVVSASRAVLASAPETYFALLVLKTIVYGMIITLLSAHHVSAAYGRTTITFLIVQAGTDAVVGGRLLCPTSWFERGGTLNGAIPLHPPMALDRQRFGRLQARDNLVDLGAIQRALDPQHSGQHDHVREGTSRTRLMDCRNERAPSTPSTPSASSTSSSSRRSC